MHSLRSTLRGAAVLAACAVLCLPWSPRSLADDTSLLREEGAKAFLFIILDTSQSMVSLDMDGNPVMTYEDSRLASAKRALYHALVDVPDVNLGIVSFGGKDQVRVVGKHWLYEIKSSVSNQEAIDSLPTNYPDIGAQLFLGPEFGQPSGTCDSPLTDEDELSTYAKLGADSQTTTEQWYREGGRTYRLTWRNPSAVDKLGKSQLKVSLKIERLASGSGACDGPTFTGSPDTVSLDLDLVGPRLIMSSSSSEVILADEQKKSEATNGGRWDYQAVRGDYTCGPDKPFSAQGIETNDDTSLDLGCTGLLCNNWLFPTQSDASGYSELDSGDAIFWHYSEDRRTEVLQRLNPLHPGGEEFGVASLLEDDPDPLTGFYDWKDSSERTYLGAGNSPLSDALLDIRCWLSGPGRPKCRNNNLPFTDGFNDIATANDLEWEICKQTYFMIVSDGENNCEGENPSADIAGFFRDLGTRTWYFNVEPGNSGAVQSIIRPGQGEAITVGSEDELTRKMNEVIGLILERQRTFASAAIPSVSHDVEDKVVITSFRPFNDSGYWEGHTTAFLKPLPLDALGRPDLEHDNFLWDTADVLLSQARLDVSSAVTASDLRLGAGLDRRRVYFPMGSDGGTVPRVRQLLGPPDGLSVPAGKTISDVVIDQWQGLGIVGDGYSISGAIADTTEYSRALSVFRKTYGIKEMDVLDEDGVPITVEYVQGDIFHSNPLVIGGPTNPRWFELDYNGYREFALKQLRRRKLLLACANDGFCHGFDAGVFRSTDGEFDSGTGTELFAVTSRQVMPIITDLAEGTSHQWGMDGSPRVIDVFMDPAHDGTPTAAEREWRTLALVGGRRGSHSFLALDLTNPDPMAEVTDDLDNVLGYVPESESVLPQNADYPSIPWEFEDTADEDMDGAADMGEAWSTPNLGLIRILEGEEIVDKFVAAFSGGLGPGGNWLYMVDLETGKAIYKQRLDSAAPAEVAAVDADRDGYWDRIYATTVGGFVYRADIGVPKALSSTTYGPRVTDSAWQPKAIFTTGGRPIYFAPQVIFVGRLGRYALAFGTGNRDNLWTRATVGGERFYLFVDESHLEDDDDLPISESRFYEVLPDDDANGVDFLTTRDPGFRGWYLVLSEDDNERLLSAALAFPSVVTYSTFVPNLDASTSGNGSNSSTVCTRSGVSRNYIQFTLSGDGTIAGEDGSIGRFQEVDDFITDPYVEWRSTDQTQEGYEDPLDFDPVLRGLWDALVEHMPRDCEISPNAGFSVNAIRSDTGVTTLAVIPQCKRMSNWVRK